MRRVFLGLPVPNDLSRRLSRMQGGIDGARWTGAADFHITLAFIGEIDEAALVDADRELQDVRAAVFDYALTGTGSFAQGKWPNVLWMGVEAPPQLAALKAAVDAALRRAGVPFEQRKYSPHVTMARLGRHAAPDETARFMQAHNLFRSETVRADHFVLYESLPGGAQRYLPLAEYPLLED